MNDAAHADLQPMNARLWQQLGHKRRLHDSCLPEDNEASLYEP